jgi:S1-C subfamily serine protease
VPNIPGRPVRPGLRPRAVRPPFGQDPRERDEEDEPPQFANRPGIPPGGRPPFGPSGPQPGTGRRVIRITSGTGFVIATNHILTNYHVIEGGGDIVVHVPKTDKKLLDAQVIAQNAARDMALIKVQFPPEVTLKPIALAEEDEPGRGQQVAVLGYPLGVTFGLGLKMTTGVISAVPEEGNDRMMLLDARVNPGNSGGPVCDSYGRVIGMVTAKSFSSDKVDSYGMAIPAEDLLYFIRTNLKGYKLPRANHTKKAWDEIDKLVSSSVLMILHANEQQR